VFARLNRSASDTIEDRKVTAHSEASTADQKPAAFTDGGIGVEFVIPVILLPSC
jgi:hypothetical protein